MMGAGALCGQHRLVRFLGHQSLQGRRAGSIGQTGHMDIVLDHQRNAVQRPLDLPGRALAVALVRQRQRVGVEVDERVEMRLALDSCEQLGHQLRAAQFTRGQLLLQPCKGRVFGHLTRLRV